MVPAQDTATFVTKNDMITIYFPNKIACAHSINKIINNKYKRERIR